MCPDQTEPPAETNRAGLDFSGLLAETDGGTGGANDEVTDGGADIDAPLAESTLPPEPVAEEPVVEPPKDPTDGLDRETITLAEVRAIRRTDAVAGLSAVTGPGPAPAPAAFGHVRATHCPAGHPNPLTAVACRRCSAAITNPAVSVIPRPILARLVFGPDHSVDVDRPQIIGRRPSAPEGAPDSPNLITIPSPDGGISRNHLAVRLVGWDVLVEDLGSLNGTLLRQPGSEPTRLVEFRPTLVVPGTEVILGPVERFRIAAPEQ